MNMKRLSVQVGCGLGLVLVAGALAAGRAGLPQVEEAPAPTAAAARQASEPAGAFEIKWYTVDGGGGTSTGGAFSLRGAIGQPDAGDLEGGPFVLRGGFIQPAAPSAPPCPWDISGDGVINATDLAGLLGRWGTVDGVPPDDAAADFDGSGAVNASDLASLLGHWGTCPA